MSVWRGARIYVSHARMRASLVVASLGQQRKTLAVWEIAQTVDQALGYWCHEPVPSAEFARDPLKNGQLAQASWARSRKFIVSTRARVMRVSSLFGGDDVHRLD
jgi:hypothetical protein